jgi:cyclophilin family peptidyl-prolyl cis-trans isomerase
MGNEPSKVNSNTMGNRASSNNNNGMGRRATSSFDVETNNGNNNDDNRLRVNVRPSATTNNRGLPVGNASGPFVGDLFATPRTVFLELAHGPYRNCSPSQQSPLGRIEIELFEEVTQASQQFYLLCTGERGNSDRNPEIKFNYKDSVAHRIIPGFLCMQAGDISKFNGSGANETSIYPGEIVPDTYPGRSAKHFPLCVAVAHAGRGSLWTSQFYILSARCKGEWLDGKNQVFGKVVAGQEICDIIESYGSEPSGTVDGCIMITNCGETEESKARSEAHKRRQIALQAASDVNRVINNNNNVTAVPPPVAVPQLRSSIKLDLPPFNFKIPSQAPPNNFIYLDFSIQGTPIRAVGRVTIELFTAALPRTAENFRCLATGEKNDYRLHYKGTPVHRIVPNFCLQMGDAESQSGSGGRSIYGKHFNDELARITYSNELNTPYADAARVGYLNHFTGCVACAVSGKDKNNSQFYILTAPDIAQVAHLDGRDVVFGRVIDGWKHVKYMENNHHNRYIITACGELEFPPHEFGNDAAPGVPPPDSLAYFYTHPQCPHPDREKQQELVASDFTQHAQVPSSASRNQRSNDDDDETHQQQNNNNNNNGMIRSSSRFLVPNEKGIINPPLVRAFENSVLPPELQSFVQDFLRIIECPVCLATFDSYGRVPVTFACGHSTCYNHVHLLDKCPVCRFDITSTKDTVKPNIVLRDLCEKFAPTDAESVEQSKKTRQRARTPPKTRTTLETFARGGVAESMDLNAPPGPSLNPRPSTPLRIANNTRATVTATATNAGVGSSARTLTINNAARRQTTAAAASTNTSTNTYRASTDPNHRCPVQCDVMRSQRYCCSCMDKRPTRTNEFSYPEYRDGQGHTNTAARWAHYCPHCKTENERLYYRHRS